MLQPKNFENKIHCFFRVPLAGLAAAPGSPMHGSSPVPIEPDDSPPGLYMDDGYNDTSYGGNGSLTRWGGDLSVYSGGGGSVGGQRSPMPVSL